MLTEIDFDSDEAIYVQLCNQIIMGIATSVIREGDSLPSVRQLADMIGVNMHTVNKAYSVLEREGYIYSVPGKGSFVADISQLKDVRREEIRRALEQTARRAFVSGISKDEFLEDAGKAYEKRREQE